jgi:hypothetical protein
MVDPIHPLIPGEPAIPSVPVAGNAGRIAREQRRDRYARGEQEPAPDDDPAAEYDGDTGGDDADEPWDGRERRSAPRDEREDRDDDGPGLHIDITV